MGFHDTDYDVYDLYASRTRRRVEVGLVLAKKPFMVRLLCFKYMLLFGVICFRTTCFVINKLCCTICFAMALPCNTVTLRIVTSSGKEGEYRATKYKEGCYRGHKLRPGFQTRIRR